MNSTDDRSSNAAAEHHSSRQTSPVAGNRWTGRLLLAIIVVPMLAAYLIFKTGFGIPSQTVNKGDLLIPATSVSDLSLQDGNGNGVAIPGAERVWRLVIVGDNACDATCRDLLYLSRQVHIRLGDKAPRVQRLFLNTAAVYSAEFGNFLEREHELLQRLHLNARQWQKTFADTSIGGQALNGHHLYLVDQEGFAMMSYGPGHSGGDLLGDIKRLLKYSYQE